MLRDLRVKKWPQGKRQHWGKDMASIFKKPKAPPLPPLPEPLPKLEKPGEEQITTKRRRRGRSNTILTGELIPMGVGKKTLLG